MGILKKTKVSEPEAIKVNLIDGPVVDPSPAVYTIKEPDPPELINVGNIASLRGEIMAKLPALRELDHGCAFFCDEVLRALNGLESNMETYCARVRMEAQRAAISQGDAK